MDADLSTLLLAVLSQRAEAGADPQMQALLAEIAGPGGGEAPNFQEMIEQLGNNDPKMRALMNYLAARQSEAARQEQPESPTVSEIAGAEAPHEKLARACAHLNRQVHKLYAELEQLRERNDRLAAALGACYLCWGENPDCPVCQGVGAPGFFMPDQELCAQVVAPAIRKLRAKKEVAAKGST